ncbi:hypothetical protein TcWFU_009150 [Taenia crassiceps]|uniref:Roadblock/LAMTOR2 domain-containing protein n=1 Tax=Taenia crassiceps TaxID=6207 RepID=A0ABR4Q3X7_9CEST
MKSARCQVWEVVASCGIDLPPWRPANTVQDGIAIRTTLENSLTVHYCGLIQTLINKSSSVVKDLDPTNDLTFLRVRSKKSEIMVAPQRDLLLIVIQKA